MKLTQQQITDFQETVWDYYRRGARSMPWRENPQAYWVLVSELMLQQTQVSRVIPKFQAFIARFPTIDDLAAAPLSEVLRAWNGLGYNRRAKFLHQTAQSVVTDFAGALPSTFTELVSLPGVGKNTAGAILNYAFNQPTPFIETNIRTVYFHHFFPQGVDVPDKDLFELAEQTIDTENPREWHWALMDYGAYLKQTKGNNISQSRHYIKQSKFEGSRRQIRGKVLKLLLEQPQTLAELSANIADDRLTGVLLELEQEYFITYNDGFYKLTDQPKLP